MSCLRRITKLCTPRSRFAITDFFSLSMQFTDNIFFYFGQIGFVIIIMIVVFPVLNVHTRLIGPLYIEFTYFGLIAPQQS